MIYLDAFIPIVTLAGEFIQHAFGIVHAGFIITIFLSEVLSQKKAGTKKSEHSDLLILLAMVTIVGAWRITEYFANFEDPWYQIFVNLPATFFVIFFASHLVSHYKKSFSKQIYNQLVWLLVINFFIDIAYRILYPVGTMGALESGIQAIQTINLYFFVMHYLSLSSKNEIKNAKKH